MKYSTYLRLFSLLLILTGFSSILMTGSEYTGAVWMGIIVAIVHGILGERLPAIFRIPRLIWNLLAVVLLLVFIYDTFYGAQDLVGNGIKFVIYLQVVKLLSPKTNRDHLQIYLLSFLQILASTVLSSDVAFALPFLIYVILATWTLTLFTLRTQLEAASPAHRKDVAVRSLMHSKDIITPRFLGFTSLLSMAIIGVTMMVFFAFPRLSMGQFLRRISVRQRVSGFSDKVELGTIGTIKTNDSIAMRVELSPETMQNLDTEKLYWRGTAADAFDGRTWSQSMNDRQRLQIDAESGVLAINRADLPGGKPLTYKVFLEALNPPILFGADRLFRITWDRTALEKMFRGNVALERDDYFGIYFISSMNLSSDLSYVAESMIGQPHLADLREESTEIPSRIRTEYLKLPELDPEVRTLIENIPVPKGPMIDQVRAIVTWLEDHYKYTLDVRDAGTQDPLHFFFLERKMGHCEYFSTALTVALRVHGIPARHVVGFRGGEPNPYGNYLAVRQSDAHTWVEVFFPVAGWIRFDPSPADSRFLLKTAYFRKFFQMTDYLRLRWNKYIVEYDLRSQAQVIERIGRQMLRMTRGATKSTTSDQENTHDVRDQVMSILKRPGTFFVGVGILGIVAVGWFYRARRRRATGRVSAVLSVLAARGIERLPSETVWELGKRAEKLLGPLPPLETLLSLYERERFGRHSVSIDEWNLALEHLKEQLKSVKKAA